MRRPDRLIAAAAALSVAACSAAPPYARPAVPVPADYKGAAGWQPAGLPVPAAGAWWQIFRDTTLDGLEARIDADNANLAAAAARYQQARALIGQARADRFPAIDAGVDAVRERVSAGRPLASNGAATYNSATIGASLSYELDLFGRVRASVAAAEANEAAGAADVAAVRLGLQAQLAATYFDMRALDARIALLRETVAAFQRAFTLTDTRHGGGIASGIDVSRAQNQLSSARAELSAVAIDRSRDEHAIAVLVGEPPAAFAIPVVAAQVPPPAIPAGLPSTLLERRPDIAAAERRVAAANARIGVARAALFPASRWARAPGSRRAAAISSAPPTASGRSARSRRRCR